MRLKKTVRLLFFVTLTTLIAACSDDNDRQDINDQTTVSENTEVPEEIPQPQGNWIEARIFKIDQQAEEDDSPNTCGQTDFRVNARSGEWSHNACANTKSGKLTASEFRELDRRVMEAYTSTTSDICPQIFKFNEFYTSIDSSDDDLDRNFDPDNACFSGDEGAANDLEQYLIQLLTKYT